MHCGRWGGTVGGTLALWGGSSRTTICDINLFLGVSFLTCRGTPTYFFQVNPVLLPRTPRVPAARVKASLSHSLVFQKTDEGRGGPSPGSNGARDRDTPPYPRPVLPSLQGLGPGLERRQGCGTLLLHPGLCIQGRKHPSSPTGLICLRSCTCRHTHWRSQTVWHMGRRGS